jgi:HAD superfamily hydrolase (TIGR01509 family)
MEQSFKAVILDVDGTLVDSNEAHAEAWQRALGENGFQFTIDAICKLIGMGGDKLLPTLCGIEEESELGRRISARRTEIYKRELLPGLKLLAGANELLDRLRSEGLRLAIATSSKKDELESLARTTGLRLDGLERITKDDADSSKPDPDLIEAALRALGVQPHEAVMIGDTPYDIHAAKNARVKTIAFRSGGWDRPGLQGAIALYDEPADLLDHWTESPLASASPAAA